MHTASFLAYVCCLNAKLPVRCVDKPHLLHHNAYEMRIYIEPPMVGHVLVAVKKSLPVQDEPEKMRQLVYDCDMRLIMNDEQLQTLEQVNRFPEGSETIEFRGLTAEEKYCWITEVLIRFKYHRLERDEKGVIRRYIERITVYSRARISRRVG